MRLKTIGIVLALCATLALWAETPAKTAKPAGAKTKPAGAKKTATKASAPKAQPKGATAATRPTGKKAAAGKKSTSGRKTSAKQTASQASRYRRSAQKEPAPDRYKEIQQSLAEKGYFAGPVNGTWGPDSVEALKRFQRDQNIGDDGKLGSLSLIALGLGPKRGAPGSNGGAEKPENSEAPPPHP